MGPNIEIDFLIIFCVVCICYLQVYRYHIRHPTRYVYYDALLPIADERINTLSVCAADWGCTAEERDPDGTAEICCEMVRRSEAVERYDGGCTAEE